MLPPARATSTPALDLLPIAGRSIGISLATTPIAHEACAARNTPSGAAMRADSPARGKSSPRLIPLSKDAVGLVTARACDRR